jgi:phasin family protein
MLQCSKLLQTTTHPLPEHSMLNMTSLATAQQANIEAMLALTAKTFEGVEQLTALNLQVAKANLDEVAQASRAALSAKDPQSLMALQAEAFQPTAEKAAAYGRQVYDIVATMKAEIERVAAEQSASVQQSFTAAIEEAAKHAPEGSGNGMAMFKSAMDTANKAFEGMQKATRQATDVAQANFTAATASVAKSTGKAKRS